MEVLDLVIEVMQDACLQDAVTLRIHHFEQYPALLIRIWVKFIHSILLLKGRRQNTSHFPPHQLELDALF